MCVELWTTNCYDCEDFLHILAVYHSHHAGAATKREIHNPYTHEMAVWVPLYYFIDDPWMICDFFTFDYKLGSGIHLNRSSPFSIARLRGGIVIEYYSYTSY